jgi:hypothetical protein
VWEREREREGSFSGFVFLFFFGLEKMDVCVRCRERKHGETLLFITLCFSLYLLFIYLLP